MTKPIEIDKQDLYDLYVIQEMSTKDIAKIYSTTSKTIRLRLHKYGFEVRQSTTINRKYKINENYFDSIDTQNKAYVLGLLCADGWLGRNKYGNLNKIGFAFQSKDLELLEFIANELNYTGNIKQANGAYTFTLCSTYLASKVSQYEILDNKSLTLDIGAVVSHIDEGLIPSFILGYFDGDGGIYCSLGSNKKTLQWSCGFTGTKDTCLFLKSYFDTGFLVDEKSKSGLVYTYKISGRLKVADALSKLYENHEGYCLKRKRDRFLSCKKSS